MSGSARRVLNAPTARFPEAAVSPVTMTSKRRPVLAPAELSLEGVVDVVAVAVPVRRGW